MKAAEDKLQTAIVSYLKMEYNVLYCASLGGQYQRYHSQRQKPKGQDMLQGFQIYLSMKQETDLMV